MRNSFRIAVTEATEPYAQVTVSLSPGEATAEFRAAIYGPRCAYARTLPTTFTSSSAARHQVDFLIQDPCYWTPALPFLYELSIEAASSTGMLSTERRPFGLRRLTPRRRSLYLEGKRIVLRGVHAGSLTDSIVAQVRDAEASLVVPMPTDAELQLANVHGIPLIVDLRGQAPEQEMRRLRIADSPSVVMVLLDRPPAAEGSGDALVAVVVGADRPAAEISRLANRCSVAIELGPADRLPAWAADCERPVIAIRRGGAYPDFMAARAACDHLQADLAPAFDLAGYLV